MGQQAEEKKRKKKDKTERVTGLGRKTREEIVKWNQMTAVRLQTGGELVGALSPINPRGLRQGFRQGEDIRYPRPPFGGFEKTEPEEDSDMGRDKGLHVNNGEDERSLAQQQQRQRFRVCRV